MTKNTMQPEPIFVSGKFAQYSVELLLQKEYCPDELAVAMSSERIKAIERLVRETEENDAMWPLFGGTLFMSGDTYQAFPHKICLSSVKKKK